MDSVHARVADVRGSATHPLPQRLPTGSPGTTRECMQGCVDADIDAFLAGDLFAVAGASTSRRKYGNRVLRCYWQKGFQAVPINPNHATVEGAPSYPHLRDVPKPIHGISLITQPRVSIDIVEEAVGLGVRHFWFQPGAEHPSALERARSAGSVVIAEGPCVLVVLGYRPNVAPP